MEVVHTTKVIASCGRCAMEITTITCIPVRIGEYRIILDPCHNCIKNAKIKAVEEYKLKDVI